MATDSPTTHLNPSITRMHKNNNPFDQSMRDLSIMRGFGEIVPSPKKFKYFLSNSIFYPTKGVFHAEIWETRRIRGVSSFIWSICKGFSLLYVLYVVPCAHPACVSCFFHYVGCRELGVYVFMFRGPLYTS